MCYYFGCMSKRVWISTFVNCLKLVSRCAICFLWWLTSKVVKKCMNFTIFRHHLEPHLVLSGSHALIDLFELAVVRAQEFEGFGYGGHGGGGGADQSAQLLQSRVVQLCVLLLQSYIQLIVWTVSAFTPWHTRVVVSERNNNTYSQSLHHHLQVLL